MNKHSSGAWWMGLMLAVGVVLGFPTAGAAQADATEDKDQIIEQLQRHVGDLAAEVEKLRAEVDGLKKIANENSVALADVVTHDGGSYISDLLGQMKRSTVFRQQVQSAVQGKLVFDNQTGFEQRMTVNGVQWRVRPGRSHILVPYGEVRASLPWEAPKTWSDWEFGDGRYELTIAIRP